MIGLVLHRWDETFPAPVVRVPGLEPGGAWRVLIEAMAAEVAGNPTPWVRLEHQSLVDCAETALDQKDPALYWRTTALLGDHVPGGSLDRLRLLLSRAHESAARDEADQADRDLNCRIDALLAYGGFLISVEEYAPAFACLNKVFTIAEWAGRPDIGAISPDDARRRIAWANLRVGMGYAQLRVPQVAGGRLTRAMMDFETLKDERERQSARLLLDLNYDSDIGLRLHALAESSARPGPFLVLLVRAESLRRRREWGQAEQCLREALEQCLGDCRRAANVSYRLARLYLEHAQDRVDRHAELTRLAIRRAAEAVRYFRGMANRVGEIRARCLLSRAFIAAGLLPQGETEWHHAARLLGTFRRDIDADHLLTTLDARLHWAEGVLLVAQGRGVPARRALLEAAHFFRELDDGRSTAAVERLLAEAGRA
ncbi:hypothetical protein [Catenuloplanes japonicus]|uniref:hypothetical protein n=1 Tax=Catenuloplanes japonicus TaxID=33876 RepID=UPI000524BB45|nr:hypothetical protein [Catenuloplanes japonicus]